MVKHQSTHWCSKSSTADHYQGDIDITQEVVRARAISISKCYTGASNCLAVVSWSRYVEAVTARRLEGLEKLGELACTEAELLEATVVPGERASACWRCRSYEKCTSAVRWMENVEVGDPKRQWWQLQLRRRSPRTLLSKSPDSLPNLLTKEEEMSCTAELARAS